jgi:hypothetical protein
MVFASLPLGDAAHVKDARRTAKLGADVLRPAHLELVAPGGEPSGRHARPLGAHRTAGGDVCRETAVGEARAAMAVEPEHEPEAA